MVTAASAKPSPHAANPTGGIAPEVKSAWSEYATPIQSPTLATAAMVQFHQNQAGSSLRRAKLGMPFFTTKALPLNQPWQAAPV